MPTIKAIQWLRPNGECRPVTSEVSQEVYDAWKRLTDRGYSLEMEWVPGDSVLFEIVSELKGPAIHSILVSNDAEGVAKLYQMLLDFDKEVSQSE